VPIRTYDAEDVFELLKCHDQEITLDDLIENLAVNVAGIGVSEDTDSNKQRTATTGQVIRRMLGDKVVAFVPPDCNDWFLYIIFRDPFIAAIQAFILLLLVRISWLLYIFYLVGCKNGVF